MVANNMQLAAGVVDSINLNQVNIGDCWLYSSADVWDQTYTRILAQPLSIEATDINDYRFKDSNTTITIRDGLGALAHVVWAGYVDLVLEAGGSISGETAASVSSVGIQMPSPLFQVDNSPITDSGVLVVSMPGDGTNVVLDNGTTVPLSSIESNFTYYNSTAKIFATNTTASINLVPGIKTVYANTVQSPNVINVKGSGTIKWHTLTNACILSLQANGTNLAIIQLTGTRILPGGLTNRDYFLDIDIDIVLLDSSTVIVTGNVEINDTYVKASTWIEEEIALDTTVDVILACNASWVNAQANNSVMISKLIVSPLYNPITYIPPSIIYDGGYSYTIYTNPPVDGGTSSTVYSLPPIDGGTSA